MKKPLIVLFILLFVSNIHSTKIVETETKPNNKLKKINSLALYKFDGKLINSGRVSLVDYMEISTRFHKYLLKKFQSAEEFKIVDAGEFITFTETDKIALTRGKKIPEYDEKTFSNKEKISLEVVKTIESSLYGKITKYYEGEVFETSYIEVVLYLVDTKSKEIFWTTRMNGCLKFVADTIVQTIIFGEYTEPTIKDIREFEWKNPYELRVKDIAFEYRRGFFIPFSDKLDSGGNHIFALYFKLPLFAKTDIYNQIAFNIIPSLKSLDEDNPLKDYQYTTYLPLFFEFIYNLDKFIKFKNLRPFAKAGFGTSFVSTYYSGTGTYIKPENQLIAALGFGVGVEYTLNIGVLNLWKFYIKMKKLGVIGYLDYNKWFSSTPTSNSLNLSLGLKYYF